MELFHTQKGKNALEKKTIYDQTLYVWSKKNTSPAQKMLHKCCLWCLWRLECLGQLLHTYSLVQCLGLGQIAEEYAQLSDHASVSLVCWKNHFPSLGALLLYSFHRFCIWNSIFIWSLGVINMSDQYSQNNGWPIWKGFW